ncbi:succinyl-diaminopimelate desuccinylase [Acidisoma cellulosilytica]|uniref:Succinyl-diaminopimelate desuccinylase n=1 Tax=Acidisoma cellulosilyticum TaxID=2802395 RepID=A0A963Z0H0_9PROT|nr:succinyl-diaminopimelate desuccinylase [Acidisoma cellulosilyticum]
MPDLSLQALTDPLPLAQALLRCASVTPADAGAQDVLAEALSALGFTINRLPFGETPNLYARLGTEGPHFCFAGHTDVVPPGEGWTFDPFGGVVADGILYGRGACDMKAAIAAFVAGVAQAKDAGKLRGSVSLLITGDEEGPARDGTVRVVDWMRAQGEVPDFCLVGEPTNPEALGDIIKIGRRGSLSAAIAVPGVQGHAAYPHLADNPIHKLLALLQALVTHRLDEGNRWFQPSSLQVTSVDVGNPATNVIPARATAKLNIRYNDAHSAASLEAWIMAEAERHAPGATIAFHRTGESFLTDPGGEVEKLAEVLGEVFGRTPKLDTGGGTSDARFITHLCPVAEFGLVGQSMHKLDEQTTVADLRALAGAYATVLERFSA